jgi:hypothetical protein
MNLMLSLQKKPVRAAIRPSDTIERIARESGLTPHVSRDVGRAWHVAVFSPRAYIPTAKQRPATAASDRRRELEG